VAILLRNNKDQGGIFLKISDLSVDALKAFITGDGSPSRSMSGPEMVEFFNLFGINDIYDFGGGGLPGSRSRKEYAVYTLKKLNGTAEFRSMIEALVDSRRVKNPDETASAINEIIKHDGYILEKDSQNVYKVSGKEIEDTVDVEAHFRDIRARIIDSIDNAKFLIWVAVAWFTDKELGNKLLEKHKAGINVRVIVNDDEITAKSGLRFGEKGIEYNQVSPSSPRGKAIMHNKFCVIDLRKVILGSYNWTNNAKYNNESITITENREIAEDFASQFIQLKQKKFV
jgi:phosphatidylserine/phosphatidylglycerophosphate/cardiolipin synthase-like enzyme